MAGCQQQGGHCQPCASSMNSSHRFFSCSEFFPSSKTWESKVPAEADTDAVILAERGPVQPLCCRNLHHGFDDVVGRNILQPGIDVPIRSASGRVGEPGRLVLLVVSQISLQHSEQKMRDALCPQLARPDPILKRCVEERLVSEAERIVPGVLAVSRIRIELPLERLPGNDPPRHPLHAPGTNLNRPREGPEAVPLVMPSGRALDPAKRRQAKG